MCNYHSHYDAYRAKCIKLLVTDFTTRRCENKLAWYKPNAGEAVYIFRCPRCAADQPKRPEHGQREKCSADCGCHWTSWGNALYLEPEKQKLPDITPEMVKAAAVVMARRYLSKANIDIVMTENLFQFENEAREILRAALSAKS